MKHRSAVALLESLGTMLTTCLDEKRCQGLKFNREAWAVLCELVDSPLFRSTFARLVKMREEDRALADKLFKLIAEVVPIVAQEEADVSPEESENRMREECPLFTEADLQDEADEAKRIRNAPLAKWAKSPENRVDHYVQGRLHIVEMFEDLLAPTVTSSSAAPPSAIGMGPAPGVPAMWLTTPPFLARPSSRAQVLWKVASRA